MSVSTRDRILDAAQELLQTRSFTGFSFDDLAKRVGIRKPSLYHHFKSKDALGAEVLARVGARLETLAASGATGSGAEQLQTYLEVMGEVLGAGSKLCPGGSFAAGWGVVPNSIRTPVKRMGAVHLAWIGRALERGRADGSVQHNGRPTEATARWVFATLQGALMLARISGEPAAYTQVTAQLMDALRSRSS
jgi:TetR/AcrR family transcriptional repressor of nem operon